MALSRCPDCKEYVDTKFKKTHRCVALSFKELIYKHKKFWISYWILAGATVVYGMMLWSL